MSDDAYDRHVLEQAQSMSQDFVEDCKKLDSFPHTDEGERAHEEFCAELREGDLGGCHAWRDDNGVPCYSWPLAGPHFGQVNIRIVGLICSGITPYDDPYPSSAELQCVQGGRWTPVCPENNLYHLSIAYIVVGYSEDLLEQWEAELKEDRL